MNRLTVSLIVLSAIGGCMGLDRDLEDNPYGSPRRSSAQGQTWPPATQGGWRTADGKQVQSAYGDWGSQSYGTANTAKGWSNAPPSTTTAKKNSSSNSTTTATAKAPVKKPVAPKSDSSDDDLVKATYTEAKGSDTSATAERRTSAKSSQASAQATKTPPVNLGVLRLLNTKRVTFHYEVKDPSSAGVAGLELWGTTDTRSWKKYDIVTRTPNSLVVDVKEEGLYGFTMIARGKGEMTKNQPPLPGEPPQVWVAVDMTKPMVQLLGAELNVMSQTPALVIRWNAKDRNLGPRPVTLLYAERLEGPWVPIAANVENSGRYEWSMPACVPSSVYVRVQAADVMGNLGIAQTTTLHIPGRTTAPRGEPALVDPANLGKALPPTPYDSNLRPVAATVVNPAVSILSVDGD